MNGEKDGGYPNSLTDILEREFLIRENWNKEKLVRAAKALEGYKNVEEFLERTGWGRDNPECMTEEYLTENRICRWINGRFFYFSSIMYELQEQDQYFEDHFVLERSGGKHEVG